MCYLFVTIDDQLSRDVSRQSVVPPLFPFSTQLYHMVNEIIARKGGTFRLLLRCRFPMAAVPSVSCV